MPKKYPLLTLAEILEVMQHHFFKIDNRAGSHDQYIATINGELRRVTVDMGKTEFGEFLIKSMIRQSGLTREEFYCSSKSAAKKIGMRKK